MAPRATHVPDFAGSKTPAAPRAVSRRHLLEAGGLGILGLNLATLPRLARASVVPRRPIESCITIFYYGGPCHIDTWDLKPRAPAEVRGEFSGIATKVPGLSIGEHLPHCAEVMDRLAVVRSVRHPMRNHNSAAVEALCGRTPLRGDLELLANDPSTDFPCFGSAVSRLTPPRPEAPSYVALPHVMHNVVMLPGQTAGFLGAAYEPLRIERDPNAADFRVPELNLPDHLSVADLDNRQSLWQLLDAQADGIDTGSGSALARYYTRAFDLLRSPAVRRALDLVQEPAAMRDRYGRSTHGQSVLLARRLVEAGVRFISVYDKQVNGLDNWDTHVNNFGRLKNVLLPPADQALAALVDDLDERGLLETTLVMAIGEFGRTPKINGQGGRDHWPDCFSVVLAGGGVCGGAVYGASDAQGAYVERDPVTPGDLAATIFWRFGLEPGQFLHDASGRPYRLAEGEPIGALFT